MRIERPFEVSRIQLGSSHSHPTAIPRKYETFEKPIFSSARPLCSTVDIAMMRVAKLVLAATLAFTSARVCFAVQTETNHNPRKLFSNVNKETSSVSRALQGGDECPTDCECLIIPKKPPCFSGMATVEVSSE